MSESPVALESVVESPAADAAPAYTGPSFADLGLGEALLKALATCGYEQPTVVQAQAIPAAIEGRDVLASSNTGTGKTAAFVLPALHRLATTPRPQGSWGPRILVLTPTRELASQILDAVRQYSKFARVQSGAIVGGAPYRVQMDLLRRRLDFLVATPGRLIDHLGRGTLDLSAVEMLVLDEADRMLDMGFREPVERISSGCPEPRQSLLFTATLDKAMAGLAAKLLTDPVRIDVAGKKLNVDAIEQSVLACDDLGHKERLLDHLCSRPEVEKAIIFAATKRDADRLADVLAARGHAAAALHGDMKQSERNRTLMALRSGRVRLLVATDVAARGLDVSDISHVINFDLPRAAEDYVHRVGRTGRAGAQGVAFTFVGRSEWRLVRAVEGLLGRALKEEVIPGFEPAPRQRRPDGPARRHSGRAGRAPSATATVTATLMPAVRGRPMPAAVAARARASRSASAAPTARAARPPIAPTTGTVPTTATVRMTGATPRDRARLRPTSRPATARCAAGGRSKVTGQEP